MAHIVRLFVDHPLSPGQSVPLGRDDAHRLGNVMRMQVGEELLLINGRDGEWAAEIAALGKKDGVLRATEQTRPLLPLPDLWLLFAPIKKERTAFIVEKATELGVARLQPVLTDFTQGERVRADKLRAHMVGAVEQCGGTALPRLGEPKRLSALLDAWPQERRLMFCDETADTGTVPSQPGPWAILIGPEGGFSEVERARLRALAHTVSLGPRILRADTAAVAALTLWQAKLGDWR